MSLLTLKDFSILVDGLDHPEGVAWGPDEYLYAGGEAGQVYRIHLNGHFTEIANTGGSILGLCVDGRSNVYACDIKRRAVLRIDKDGDVSVCSDGSADRKMVQPNFALFDRFGNLFVSDSGGWHENNGCVFRIAPGGETEVLSTAVSAFPNGMALSLDGNHLYVVLSNLPGVVRLELNKDGSVGSPKPVIELPKTVPDGLAFDLQGGLYISCYVPDLIYRLSTGGELSVVAQDHERTLLSSPTNLSFCGADLCTLVAANYGCWHLLQTKTGVPGAPLHYPLMPKTTAPIARVKNP